MIKRYGLLNEEEGEWILLDNLLPLIDKLRLNDETHSWEHDAAVIELRRDHSLIGRWRSGLGLFV